MTKENIISIYNRHYNSVYRLALSYTHSISDAEDIVQVVFLKLMEKSPRLEVDKERSYLATVTANACKDLLKSNWKRKMDNLENVPESQLGYMTEDESELFYAVMNLPVKYRVVIHLHFYEGYTFKEIAKILKISTSAVSMRIHRSKELLRTVIEKEE